MLSKEPDCRRAFESVASVWNTRGGRVDGIEPDANVRFSRRRLAAHGVDVRGYVPRLATAERLARPRTSSTGDLGPLGAAVRAPSSGPISPWSATDSRRREAIVSRRPTADDAVRRHRQEFQRQHVRLRSSIRLTRPFGAWPSRRMPRSAGARARRGGETATAPRGQS